MNVKPATSVLCPGRRLRSVLLLVGLDRGRAEDEQRETEVRDAHAEDARRQRMSLAQPLDRLDQRGERDPQRGDDADSGQHRVPAVREQPESPCRARSPPAKSTAEQHFRTLERRLLPRRVHAGREQEHQRQHRAQEHVLKYGGPTETPPRSSASRNIGYSVPSRISAVAATSSTLLNSRNDSRETGAKPAFDVNSGARHAYSTSAPPTQITRNTRMNRPRARIARERVHRFDDAGAHQERAEQRQRERRDREQQRPALEQSALLGHRQRMNQRRADQPRHERGVLDRIPEPPAAPAELVVRPPAAERDADRQEHPRDASSTVAPSAPTANRACLRASPRPRTRTAPRCRRSRCRASADESRAPDPAAADSDRDRRPRPATAARTDSTSSE